MRIDWRENHVSKSDADRLDGGTWRAVSFEYNDDGWYMPGHPDVSPVGLWARERQD